VTTPATSANTVLIHILGKEYPIACTPEEEAALKASAEYLDGKMRDIRETGKVIGLERIAVMAALNISHEFLQSEETNVKQTTGSADSMGRISSKLDNALNRFKQLEI
jgi:cell division protein ZapA